MADDSLVHRPLTHPVRNKWVLWLAGSLSVIAGLLAVVFPFAAAVGFEIFLGWALIVVGLFELGRAFTLRKAGRILAVVLYGLLAIGTGVLLLLYPIRGLAALTVVVAAFLVAGGLIRTWAALGMRPRRGWGWMTLSGVLSVFLGALLLSMMPLAAYWALGILIGVDLFFFGLTQLFFAAAPIPERPAPQRTREPA